MKKLIPLDNRATLAEARVVQLWRTHKTKNQKKERKKIMSEISFERKTESVPTTVAGVTVACETTVCDGPVGAVGDCAAPGVPAIREEQSLAPVSDLIGDSFPSFDQIILPRINLVQGSGQLKDSFPFGALVFNQNTLLFALPVAANTKTNQLAQPGLPPVTITVLHVRPTRFAEKVQWPEKGRICNSEAEVQSLGGTISWQEHQMKKTSGMTLFEYMTDTVVAIEKPDHLADDDSVFCYPVDGKKYTIGLWNFKATAYVAACKRTIFYARRMGVCIKGYPTHSFSASTRIEPGKGNSYIVPVLVPRAKSTPEFLEFARSILSPQ